MRFKAYYEFHKTNKTIFESTFNKYYDKGYFGTIDKNELKKQYRAWFEKLLYYTKEKNLFELCMAVSSKENRFSRDMFSQITGIEDIKYKTKEEVIQIVEHYCTNDNTVLIERFINKDN